jgi:DNA (cytosine-5)-methyltransferase 1
MRHGSLFSGIGGFDLAAEWMEWENVFHCEWNEFGKKVLSYYWPNAISYYDITKTDFSIHRGEIDILTGGFPCQPYSSAGKRLGKEDERHLWPEMLRAIREIQPTWVVGENVLGLVNWNGGLVFHEVQTDLEAEGYEVQPYVLPAVSVNAPHRRDRVWFVAYSDRGRHGGKPEKTRSDYYEKRQVYPNIGQHRDGIWSKTQRCSETSSDPDLYGCNKCNSDNEVNASEGGVDAFSHIDKGNVNGFTADSDSNPDTEETRTDCGIEGKESFFNEQGIRGHDGLLRNATDTTSQGARQQPSEDRGWEDRRFDNDGEVQYASNTCNKRLQGSEVNGGVGKIRKDRNKQLIGCFPPAWNQFPTVSPIYTRNDGFSDRLDLTAISESKWRNESIKASGNAVVPQVVLQIFKAIEQYENNL